MAQPLPSSSTLAITRLIATKNRPYFATALFALTLVDQPGHDTMSVDQYGRVYIDTTIIGKDKRWSHAQASWVLIHELGHWLRKHHERAAPVVELEPIEAQYAASKLANYTEDAELNDDLEEEHADLPDDYVTPKNLGVKYGVELEPHQMWETYYEQCRKTKEHEKEKKAGTLVVCKHDCGSGAHGQARPWELPPPDGKGGVQGLREAEGDLLRRQVAHEILAHAGRGTVPAGWKRWADALVEKPEVPWERELQALCRNAVTMARGMVDYSYTKPSRRGMFQGVIMPAFVRPVPEAGIVIDTSGSMGDRELSAALREVQGVLRSVGQRKCPVVCVDAAVQTVRTVSSAFQIELKGGGGTDMGVGIAKLEELKCRVMIVLTDGQTPWPKKRPRGELVIGIIGDRRSAMQLPSYAKRVVYIKPAKEEAA